MKTLASPGTWVEVERRLRSVQPSDSPRWGVMSAPQMIRHLRDALRLPLGELTVEPASLGIPRPVLKVLALSVPLRWRKNIPTAAVFDQSRKAPPSTPFADDVEELLAVTQQFLNDPLTGRSHPYFGLLTRQEWMRWAWLHTDHHLRQFGH